MVDEGSHCMKDALGGSGKGKETRLRIRRDISRQIIGGSPTSHNLYIIRIFRLTPIQEQNELNNEQNNELKCLI